MKYSALALSLVASATLISCQDSTQPAKVGADDTTVSTPVAAADLKLADGSDAGRVELSRSGERISLAVNAHGIPGGSHGFHLHAIGTCTAPDFKSAGGHLNPNGNTHGKLSEGGQHLGDLPNLEVDDSGDGTMTIDLDGDAGAIESSILDEDGTAVVIHAGSDDYKTDPSGNAGPRIACGVLKVD